MEVARGRIGRRVSSALIALALLGAGCTGGASGERVGEPSARPSRDAFVEEVDRICGRVVSELQPLGSTRSVLRLSGKAVLKFQIASPIWRNFALDVERLTPPEGDGEQVQAFVDGLFGLATMAQEIAARGLSGDVSEYERQAPEFFNRMNEVIDIGRAYGFTCP